MNDISCGFVLGFSAYAVMQEVLRFIERRKQERMSRDMAKHIAESMSQMASAIEKRSSAEDEGEEWKRGRSEDDDE